MTQSKRDGTVSRRAWFLSLLGQDGFKHVRNCARNSLSHALADLIDWAIFVVFFQLTAGITEAIVWLSGGSFAGWCALKIHIGIFVIGLIGFAAEFAAKRIKDVLRIWRE